MKKILAIVLCCFTLVGCAGIETRVQDYIVAEDDNTNDILQDTEWIKLENEMRRVGIMDLKNWENEQIFESYEDYNMLTIWHADSEEGRKLVQTLQSFIGEELIAFMNEVRESDKDIVKERVIGNYGIVCTKQEGVVSVRCIKMNLSLTDKNTEAFLKEIKAPGFMLRNMSVGKDEQMLELVTPMFIRNNHIGEEENAAYYHIFRKNSGEITKIRLVMIRFNEANNMNSYVDTLQKLMIYSQGKEVEIKALEEDITKVYEHKLKKTSGTIGNINYKVIKYEGKEYERGELIEVVLETK